MKLKDINQIPDGDYCYTYIEGKYVKCPFWSSKDNLPPQEDGYCGFLDKGDYEINEEYGNIEWKNGKGEVTRITAPHEIPTSLLWDQVKDFDCPKYEE